MNLSDYLGKTHGIHLNDQQRSAMETTGGAVLLLAVPGAGKTTVLVSRVANLILNHGVPAGEILTVTFNKESAGDMARRFSQLFGSFIPNPPRFSTIHSFCYTVLSTYAAEYDRPLPTLLEGEGSPGQRNRLLRECFIAENQEYPDEELVEELSRLATYYANMMADPTPEECNRSRIPRLPQILAGYRRVKKERHLMDYDDLLTHALALLQRLPQLLARFENRYRHCHVDEAQDTSRVQHELLRLLTARWGNLFLVGDEDQSIYSFRGAFPQGLLDFAKTYPNGTILKLEENFRSTPAIVEQASRVIGCNELRYQKEMFTHRPPGPPPKITEIPDGNDLGEALYRRLLTLPPGETAAVLYRNNPSAVPLVDKLSREEMPFYIKDRPSKLQKQSITQDILSLITLYYTPDDREAFTRIYYKVGAYISKKMWEYALENTLPGQNIYQVVAGAPGENVNSARILMLKYATERFGTMAPKAVLKTILYDFDYLGYLERCSQNGFYLELCTQRLRALEHLARSTSTLEEFLTRIEEIDSLITKASQNRGCPVTLSTIHSVKGLEFDWVYLIDIQEGILPAASAIGKKIDGDPTLLEEERRLFYVALTRAKTHLEILSCQRQGETKLSPSRFLPELTRVAGQTVESGVQIGRQVLHRYFGKGAISSVDFARGTVNVRFGKMGEKCLLLAIFADSELVKLL